jgi:hypothetical protein
MRFPAPTFGTSSAVNGCQRYKALAISVFVPLRRGIPPLRLQHAPIPVIPISIKKYDPHTQPPPDLCVCSYFQTE